MEKIRNLNHPLLHQCAADVGRTPRRITKVILGGNCLSPRTIIHEIFHALGFYHEHSRPDRDTYVTVNVAPSNIERNVDLRNFNILPDMPVFNLPYDYESIMHYAPSDFAANPNDPNGAVIMPKVNGSLKIGKRDQLSVLDIARLKIAYGCLDANLGPVRRTISNNCKTIAKVEEREEEPVVSAVRHQNLLTPRKLKVSRPKELSAVPRSLEGGEAESSFLPEFSDKLMTKDQCSAQFTNNCSPIQRKKSICARFRGLEINCHSFVTPEEIAQMTAAFSRPPIRAVRVRLNDGPLITYNNFVRISTQVVQFTLSTCLSARASNKLMQLRFVRLLEFQLSWCDNLEIHKDDFKRSLQLRIIILAQSTIRTLEEDTFTNLQNLQVLSMEYGLEKLLRSQPRFRDYVARIHCECEFAWFRTWLKRNPRLLWKKDAGAIYNLQKSYSNSAYKRRDLYIPIDCSNSPRSNGSLITFSHTDFSVSDGNCVSI
ncbi:uncharacterized protein LOC129589559 [Paramacrobiotus metropolitanus]|uniref:uncharacterized protein LOC129589559 n=1 Tax=Paramacrobiotus metropolitanus TaxID=2943436 RepID=UPI00244599B4|nr:uncharacterized protein LOC129589559 [Paramacrobiotus metropolitanus]